MTHQRLRDQLQRSKTFCFDIDGVIATITPGNDYRQAQPIAKTVDLINRLYDAGHRIVLFTARGGSSGRDWTALTRQQMSAWGVRHHDLRMGKPSADYYIDDKLIDLETLSEALA